MRKLVLTLILGVMCINAGAQIKVYDGNGKKTYCLGEDFDIVDMRPSEVTIPSTPPPPDTNRGGIDALATTPAATAVKLAATLLPSIVNAGFTLIDSLVARNVRQYEAERTLSKSYLEAGGRTMPDFTIKRVVSEKDKDGKETLTTALSIGLKAEFVHNLNAAVYYVDNMSVNRTTAKLKKGDRPNYAIELVFEFLEGDKRKPVVVSAEPINIYSVELGVPKECFQAECKYRTNFVILPKDAFLAKVSVKIIETNPRKISAQKVADNWNAHENNAKKTAEELTKLGISELKAREKTQEVAIKNMDNAEWGIAGLIAKRKGSKAGKAAYEKYLAEYPDGLHKYDAMLKIKELELEIENELI